MREVPVWSRLRRAARCRPPVHPGRWRTWSATLFVGLSISLALPSVAAAQAPWPFGGSTSSGQDHVQWFLGSYVPVSSLGSFGRYSVAMEPWITIGISARHGSNKDRLRPRFEMAVTPDAIMRRSSKDCSACTSETRRLSVVHWRFLLDLTFPSPGGGTTYLTAGPFMRIQLSRTKPCPRSSGEECALSEFARRRIDPGLMVGAGWEPGWSWLYAFQLTGRLINYGRQTRPEASPAPWLEAVELSARFPLGH